MTALMPETKTKYKRRNKKASKQNQLAKNECQKQQQPSVEIEKHQQAQMESQKNKTPNREAFKDSQLHEDAKKLQTAEDHSLKQQTSSLQTESLRLKLLLLAAALSTCVGFGLVAALLLQYRGQHSLQRHLPPNVSIPARQLSTYDNGSFTTNWWRLDQCIRRLHCPPDFFACRAASTLTGGDNPEVTRPASPLYLWHHFLLLGWALFTCHQAAGMRQLFMTPPPAGVCD